MVFGIGLEAGWIVGSDDGHTLRSAGAQERELEGHSRNFFFARA
jgi:hypothetical protein